ncbi:GNAT family N-acetyltransferase [Microscilla marina]|uniref:Acetyltransferase, gnat family n=1 Tax=Microscilla marina ATCC 23134 TaxID=313606 RepID=A1ZN66_MICM2|nr:GNAT family N-acetyltransferase [Microscilla marina]EAY28247.1 acetyltransferase, gnat family [Microscilla marina ATCC 23134]
MLTLERTHSDNEDFIDLIKHLDAYLKVQDGEDHDFYAQYNKVDAIRWVLVAYSNGVAAGCGAIKPYNEQTIELKRMFVHPDHRSKGVAQAMLQHLEQWAAEEGFTTCVLETGVKQVEAIRLYTKAGYELMDNYGQYAGLATSVCMKKALK